VRLAGLPDVLTFLPSALRRDPDKCDIVLKLQDVSKVHARLEMDVQLNQVVIAALVAPLYLRILCDHSTFVPCDHSTVVTRAALLRW
jgi:hypothetical protein